MVNGQKEGEAETVHSDKRGNESQTADSVERHDSGELNPMKAKRTRGKPKPTRIQRSPPVEGRQCHDIEGADKGLKRR